MYQSGVGRLFCHVCPPGEKKRRMQVHRRKSANADCDRQRVVKCSRDVSKHSDCLIINETAVVNAHPVQNINSEFTECSIGTDGVSQDEVCQWTPTPANAWKDQERSLPSWQRCQQQLPETVILCDIRSPTQISTCRRSVQYITLCNRDDGVVSGTARCVDRVTH